MTFNLRDIESGIDDFICNSEHEFKLADICRVLAGENKLNEDQEKQLENAVANILIDDPQVLYNHENKQYISRDTFFNGGSFLIVPTELEIEQGILVPGHRFGPFCCTDIFPSEVRMRDDVGKLAEFKNIPMPVENASVFHVLLGAEQMFEFFVADNPENADILGGGGNAAGKNVILSVMAFEAFYKKYDFKHGDMIVVTIDDWTLGDFSYKYVSGEERDADATAKWIDKLGEAAEEVIEEYSNYLEIPEQLARAFYIGGRALIDEPAATLNEFYLRSERIRVGYVSGMTVLTIARDDEEDEENEGNMYRSGNVPGDVMISKGETSDFESMLKEIGSVLRPAEVEGFMLDQLYRDEPVFDVFFQRCFGGQKLNFADEAQEAVFLNSLEDIWEGRFAGYNKLVDENKGPVRSRLLEIVEERMDWLHYLNDLDVDPGKLEDHDAFTNLVSASIHFTSLCQLLNSEEHFVSGSEVESILESIEDMAELQKSYIEELNSIIARMQ